jgi:putative DNA primase/helicase
MMTKRIKVNYTPDHPGIKRWETILRPLLGEADGSSSERLDYLRRAVGYTLSGQGTEKAIFVVHGPTNSGKSTLAAGLSTAFGDYYVGVDPSLFATGTGSEAISRYSAAELDRARMAAAMELARGSRFKPSLKALVGDKDFPARAPGEKTITVRLGCVPWFFTNYVPRGMGDKAIYSRLHPIPFPNTLLDPDPDVIKWVQSDEGAAAVLSWAVKGCLEWRQQGLGKPGGLELEGDELEREDDTFGRFLRDECVSADARKPGARTKASEVLGRYQLWCQDEGEKAMTGTAFGITMREQGMGSFRGDKNVAYYPVEMRPADPHTFLASRGRVNRTS